MGGPRPGAAEQILKNKAKTPAVIRHKVSQCEVCHGIVSRNQWAKHWRACRGVSEDHRCACGGTLPCVRWKCAFKVRPRWIPGMPRGKDPSKALEFQAPHHWLATVPVLESMLASGLVPSLEAAIAELKDMAFEMIRDRDFEPEVHPKARRFDRRKTTIPPTPKVSS